ncbi:snare domain containing protein [Stylonychia lemnae]|uniref:Snare domain containing protein n=1 Tax=Stylonychia lemnae TaxID=5949 RepID=A0A078A3J1_STYLE|nr:snare domain containing protein [Stylonychia lemnae]|eukprot:CDW76848.1 snare domain containing protein [Stylonychia lemnae]
MKLFKSGVEKKLKQEKKKLRKGRPTCKKDEDEEKKKSLNPKYKFINIQMEKLENMYIVLSAEDGMNFGKQVDEFERDFQKLRADIRDIKDSIKKRAEALELNDQKNAQIVQLRYQIQRQLDEAFTFYKTLQSILRQKRKTYKEEELKNKQDRLERLHDNLEVLKDVYNDQNAFEQGKMGVKVMNDADIENQMVFLSRKEMNERAKKYEDQEDDEDAFRDMNEYENELMKKFDENDQEIDDMLDKVIEMVDVINIKAQNIGTSIKTQAELIKQVNNKAEKARKRLQKRASALQDVLEKYRKTNKMCIDMILVVVFLIFIGVLIGILKKKGYF